MAPAETILLVNHKTHDICSLTRGAIIEICPP